MKRTIIIADDHLLFAKSLRLLINEFEQYHVIEDVPHGQKLKEIFAQASRVPDIVLLDVDMPVMDGYDTARWLKDHHPAVKVVVITMHEEEAVLLRLVQNGACGYLLKHTTPAELLVALDAIAEKGYYFPGWVTHAMLTNLTKSQPVPSDRELEFLKFAATELSYKEIADKMCLSPRTIDSHRDKLFEKFNVKTRVGLVLFAIRNKLISL